VGLRGQVKISKQPARVEGWNKQMWDGDKRGEPGLWWGNNSDFGWRIVKLQERGRVGQTRREELVKKGCLHCVSLSGERRGFYGKVWWKVKRSSSCCHATVTAV